MSDPWIVDVTRRVRLAVDAAGFTDAREKALETAWEWQPGNADGGDQGSVSAVVVRAPDLHGGDEDYD